MNKKFIFAKDLILDTIFPKFCVNCGLEGTYLCENCRQKIVIVAMQVCPLCNRLSANGVYCHDCRYDIIAKKPKIKKKRKPLQGIISAAYYEEGPTREMIHNFKYNSVLEFADVLAGLMDQAYKNNHLEFDVITFAPLHPRRQAQRGYNQAEMLAQKLSEHAKVECLKLLKKNKATKRQVELSGKRRRENLKGKFALLSADIKNKIKGKKILIIDDIATTGATLNECARALKTVGAKEVWGMVVARG